MAAAAFASMFAVFGVAYSFGAFFDSMSEEFDAGSGLTALFFSLTTFLYFTLGLVTGRWSDRVGPKPVLLTGAVAMFVGLMATSVADSLWVGLASYSIGVGIAAACGYVPMVAVVGGWFESKRTLALGVAVAGIGMGTLVMAPLASSLIDAHGWRVAYRIIAVGATAILLLCALVTSRPPLHADVEPATPLGEVAGTTAFRALYGSILLMSLALFVPFVFVADYAEAHGLSSGSAALLVGLIGGASIVGRLGLGALAPRVGLTRLYQLCFAMMAASFLIWLLAADRYWVLVLFTLVLGVRDGRPRGCSGRDLHGGGCRWSDRATDRRRGDRRDGRLHGGDFRSVGVDVRRVRCPDEAPASGTRRSPLRSADGESVALDEHRTVLGAQG